MAIGSGAEIEQSPFRGEWKSLSVGDKEVVNLEIFGKVTLTVNEFIRAGFPVWKIYSGDELWDLVNPALLEDGRVEIDEYNKEVFIEAALMRAVFPEEEVMYFSLDDYKGESEKEKLDDLQEYRTSSGNVDSDHSLMLILLRRESGKLSVWGIR